MTEAVCFQINTYNNKKEIRFGNKGLLSLFVLASWQIMSSNANGLIVDVRHVLMTSFFYPWKESSALDTI